MSTAAPPDRQEVERLLEKFGQYISPSLLRLYRFMGLDTLEWDGEGAVCRDTDGKPYLDFNGCNGTLFLGRRHPAVVAAVKDQLERLTITSRLFAHAPQIQLAEKLAEITPGALQYTFFCNSGAEAVEGALKLARAATGRTQFIAARNAFHGKTFGALSATGRELYREPFQPLLPGFTHVPYGDVDALKAALNDDTAAVILEPIQGEGGVILPPPGYLKRVRELCDRNGTLLIFDEVQTGLGRTGRWYGCQHEDVAPDIITMAKILGGGVMPIGAFTARPEIFTPLDENPYIHSSTFGGNALACAAGFATLQAIEQEGLIEQAAEKGRVLLDGLTQLAADYPQVIKEVRGRGLLIGIELTSEGLGGAIINEIVADGLIAIFSLNNASVIRFLPPAVTTYEQIERGLEIFGKAVKQTAPLAGEI